MAQYGSKIDQYADKPLASDQLYSNTNRDDPAMQAAAARRKLDSRAYKSAVADSKSRDPRVRAMGFKAASDMQATGYQPQTGIPGQGEYDRQDRESADNHITVGKRASDSINGRDNPSDAIEGEVEKTRKPSITNGKDLKGSQRGAGESQVDYEARKNLPASSQVPVPGGAAAPVGGAGVAPPTTDENGLVSAPPLSAGLGAIPGATTPPVANGGAGNGTPAMSDADKKLAGIKKQMAIEKFGKDITNWTVNDPEDQGKKGARIFEYGKSLGISPEQIEAQADKARNGQVVAAKEKSKSATDGKGEEATAAFGKAYGAYLNGEGKKAKGESDDAWNKRKDDKYAELKGKAVEDGFVVTQEGKDRAAPAIEKAKQAGIAQKKEITDIISGKKSEVAGLMDDVAKARGYKDHLSMRQDEVFGENVRNDIANNEKFKSIPSEYPKTNDTSQSFVDNGQQIPFASDNRQMLNFSLTNDSHELMGFKSDGPPAFAAGSPVTSKGPETGGAEGSPSAAKDGWLDAAGSDLGSAGDFAKNYFMGGRELVNKAGKFSSGAMSNIGSLATNVAQNLVPGELGRKIREADPASKVKNTIYDATQFLPNKVLESDKTRSPDQASIDNKLQQENQKKLTASRDKTAGTVNMNSKPL